MSTAVDASAVARVVGILTEYQDRRAGAVLFLPQQIAVVGQGNTASTYATTPFVATSAAAVGSAVGFGSPLHLAALQLIPVNGDGIGTIPLTIFPLEDDGSAVAAVGDVTPSGTQTVAASYYVYVNNIRSDAFTIAAADSVGTIVAAMVVAVNAVPEMPVIATDNTTDMVLTAKWAGASSNDIVVAVTGSTTAGTSFAITQPVGGATNPDVQDALDQFGTSQWYTMVLNCLDVADTTALDAFSVFGEGRWGALVKKPLIVFSGNTETTVASAIAVPDARKTDRVNAQLVAPGSDDLPFVVAARQLARIAPRANNNPPYDYGALRATGLTPGDDGDQWDYTNRDLAVKGGSSTVEVRSGEVTIGNVITFYHPENDPLPSYRFVVDIVKLQQIIYNLGIIFESDEWNGAPLIPDTDATINPAAKRPRTAKTVVGAMLDSLGLNAIISDPATAKKNVSASINTQNPKRLDLIVPVQLSGNTNIISIDLQYGFYFGGVEAS